MDQRVMNLEIRFMHQERTIQELNDIVCRQELAIERLLREMGQLQEQLKQIIPSMNRTEEEEEPPPHY